MTQPPDKPTPPGEPDRAQGLVDAVVGDTPAPAEPASVGVSPAVNASDDAPNDDPGKNKKTKKGKPEPTTPMGKLWYSWVKPIGTVFLIVAVLRSTIIDWNDVPSGSMEPTILVGDRILVNKMAYALQVPLSGPKIGVPFTALQWDNPLDGLPSWQWGKPVRGDIVTFWNPVTGIRMVKRIVAQPGDTIELRGGVMTITPADGSPTTATYTDTTTFPPNQTFLRTDNFGKEIEAATQDAEESLLGETRSIQHIPERWTLAWGMLRLSDGREYPVADGQVGVASDGSQVQAGLAESGDGRGVMLRLAGPGIPLENALRAPGTLLLEIREGTPYLNGQAVSYNDFAAAYLKPFAQLGAVPFGDDHTLEVQDHRFLIDGEPVHSEQLYDLTNEVGSDNLGDDAKRIMQRHAMLRERLMTSSFGPVTLGADEYYMIGDNRNNSADSRYFGPVRRSEITGEAVAIPVSFHGRIRDLKPRWSRWFHGLD